MARIVEGPYSSSCRQPSFTDATLRYYQSLLFAVYTLTQSLYLALSLVHVSCLISYSMSYKNIFYSLLSPRDFSNSSTCGISQIERLHAKRNHTDTHEKC